MGKIQEDIVGLVAFSIHKQEVHDFWKNTLKADEYIMRMLEEGYKLPFKAGCTPQRCREKNNKSARQHSKFAIEETEKWITKKVVKEVFQEPTCVSPLTVAVRQMRDEEKLRLCLDLSRYIDLLLQKERVKLAGIDKCVQALLPEDFIATYDLSSAFHHVQIYGPHQQYLGFSLPGENKGDHERFFVFLVMPFGLASVVKCLTRITKPLCCCIASQGIWHSIYIDDGNVLAEMLIKVLQQLGIVLGHIERSRIRHRSKQNRYSRHSQPNQTVSGIHARFKKMSLKIAPEKIEDVRSAIKEVVQATSAVKAKRVARAIGKLILVEPALGPIVQLLSRAALSELAQATESGWNMSCLLYTSPSPRDRQKSRMPSSA